MGIRKARKADFKKIVEVNYNSDHPLNKKFNPTIKELSKWFKPKFLDKKTETYVFVERNMGVKKTKYAKNGIIAPISCRADIKNICDHKKPVGSLISIAGAITLKKDFSVHNSCEITVLAIDKRFHRRGIGSKLLRFVEERASKLGFERIFLYTSLEGNKGARKFYEKIGYKKINVFPGWYSWGDDAVLYGKRLRKK